MACSAAISCSVYSLAFPFAAAICCSICNNSCLYLNCSSILAASASNAETSYSLPPRLRIKPVCAGSIDASLESADSRSANLPCSMVFCPSLVRISKLDFDCSPNILIFSFKPAILPSKTLITSLAASSLPSLINFSRPWVKSSYSCLRVVSTCFSC